MKARWFLALLLPFVLAGTLWANPGPLPGWPGYNYIEVSANSFEILAVAFILDRLGLKWIPFFLTYYFVNVFTFVFMMLIIHVSSSVLYFTDYSFYGLLFTAETGVIFLETFILRQLINKMVFLRRPPSLPLSLYRALAASFAGNLTSFLAALSSHWIWTTIKGPYIQ